MPRVRNSAKSAASQPTLVSVETVNQKTGELLLIESKSFPVVQIQLDSAFQPRQLLNREVVEKYAEYLTEEILVENETTCPPVDLLLHENQYYLIHGHHRLEAFKRAKVGEIPAKIWSGSWDKAVQFACEANIFNGLQLSRKELATACRRYIRINDELPELEQESDRAIARRFLVDPKSVRNYRKQNQAVSLVNSWNVGSTILLAKNWEKFSLALKPFCYATYSGYFNPDDSTAYFQFDQQICFKNGQYSIFDFELVKDECIVELISPDPEIGSVVWFDDYYGFGVVYDFGVDDDGDTTYYGLSWKRGLCKAYSIFVFSESQAVALCKEFQEFFPIASDLANLLPKLIAKLNLMIQVATDDLLNDRDPITAKILITRHEKEIVELTEMLQSLTALSDDDEELEKGGGSSDNWDKDDRNDDNSDSGDSDTQNDSQNDDKALTAVELLYDFLDMNDFSIKDLQDFRDVLTDLIDKYSAYSDVPSDLF